MSKLIFKTVILITLSLNVLADENESTSTVLSSTEAESNYTDLTKSKFTYDAYLINEKLQRISDDLDVISKRSRLNWGYIKKSWNAYDENIAKQKEVYDVLDDLLSARERVRLQLLELDSKSRKLDLLIENNQANLNEVDNKLTVKIANIDSQNQGVKDNVKKNKQELFILIVVVFFVLVALVLFFVMLFRNKSFSIISQLEQTKLTQRKLEEASIKLDLRLVDYLNNQFKIEQKLATESTTTIDHAFMLTVSDEVIRMQKNIDRLCDRVKGIKPLSKGINRLKVSLEDAGYELVNLLGTRYAEQMNIDVESIIEDEKLPEGTQTITKVIRPQVNYEGKLIQRAKVEVSIN